MTKTYKELKREIKSLQIQKARGWTRSKSELLDAMACETNILNFLQQGSSRAEEVKSISSYSLFEFWKRIQDKKDRLNQ